MTAESTIRPVSTDNREGTVSTDTVAVVVPVYGQRCPLVVM